MHKTPNRDERPQTVRTENQGTETGRICACLYSFLQARGTGSYTCRLPYARRIESLDVAVKKRGQLRLGQRPDLLRLHVAVLEQHQRGYAADAVLLRDLLILVDVDLGHLELARVLLGHFVENRRDRLARAAPLRPVVHQDRDIGLEHFGLECGVAHVMDKFVHLLPLETGFPADLIVMSGRAPRSSRTMLTEFAGEGKRMVLSDKGLFLHGKPAEGRPPA